MVNFEKISNLLFCHVLYCTVYTHNTVLYSIRCYRNIYSLVWIVLVRISLVWIVLVRIVLVRIVLVRNSLIWFGFGLVCFD